MTDKEVKELLKDNDYPAHLIKAGKKATIDRY